MLYQVFSQAVKWPQVKGTGGVGRRGGTVGGMGRPRRCGPGRGQRDKERAGAGGGSGQKRIHGDGRGQREAAGFCRAPLSPTRGPLRSATWLRSTSKNESLRRECPTWPR